MFFVKDQMDHRLTYAHSIMATSMAIQTNVNQMAQNMMVAHWHGWIALLNQTGTCVIVSLNYVWMSQIFTMTIHTVTMVTIVTIHAIRHLASKTNSICSGESAVLTITNTVQMEITIHLLSEMSAETGVLHCSSTNIQQRLVISQVSGLSAEPILWESVKLMETSKTPSATITGPLIQTSVPFYQKVAALKEERTTNHALWTSTLAWQLIQDMTSVMTSLHCV